MLSNVCGSLSVCTRYIYVHIYTCMHGTPYSDNNQQWTLLNRLHAKSLQLCQILCDPTDCSPPGSSVHGVLQARERVGGHPLLQGDLPDSGTEPASLTSPALAGGFFTTKPPGSLKKQQKPWLKLGQDGGRGDCGKSLEGSIKKRFSQWEAEIVICENPGDRTVQRVHSRGLRDRAESSPIC